MNIFCRNVEPGFPIPQILSVIRNKLTHFGLSALYDLSNGCHGKRQGVRKAVNLGYESGHDSLNAVVLFAFFVRGVQWAR